MDNTHCQICTMKEETQEWNGGKARITIWCGVGEDSQESLGQQGDHNSQS